MKLRAFSAGVAALGLLASHAMADEPGASKRKVRINLDQPVTAAAAPATPAPAPTATTAPDVAPAKAPPAKTDPKDKKTEKLEVEGLPIQRQNGGYLGVTIKDALFRVRFYDAEKKPVAPDVTSIALRWPVHYQPNPERTLLTPASDGTSMASDRVVRPPYTFKLYITLLKRTDTSEEIAVESHVVDFSG